MRLTALNSSPLRPLAAKARVLSEASEELWVATAFASEAAVQDVVAVALDAGAKVRFLTGTFGNVTRLQTFRRLHRLAQTGPLEARIWKGDFHAKLFVWRNAHQATAWVGSANLTDRGLQAAGELVAELKADWNSSPLRSLRHAFALEWKRAAILDDGFLRYYKEAPRADHLLQGRARSPRTRVQPHRLMGRGVMIVATVTYHYADTSAAAKRISALLGGTAKGWYRTSLRRLRTARPGDLCLFVDVVDGTASVVRITDRKRDARAWVIAYEPFTTKPDRRLTASLRRTLTKAGLRPTSRSFKSQWLPATTAVAVLGALYGERILSRFRRELGSK